MPKSTLEFSGASPLHPDHNSCLASQARRRAKQMAQTWGPSPLSSPSPTLGMFKGIFGVADQVSRGWEGAWSFIN